MDPGTILAIVELSGSVAFRVGKYISQVKGAEEEALKLHREVEDVRDVFQRLLELCKNDNIGKLPALKSKYGSIDDALSSLEELDERLAPLELEESTTRKFLRKIKIDSLKWPFRRGEIKNFLDRIKDYKSNAIELLQTDQAAILLDVSLTLDTAEHDRLLSKLPVAEGAAFDALRLQHERRCLPETRTELLEEIQSWSITAKDHHKTIYWLYGLAGAGKSTIARTIALSFATERVLAASFFFSRGSGDLGHANKFVTTLAVQLSRIHPMIKSRMVEIVAAQDNLPQQGLRTQWEKLIVDPLVRYGTIFSVIPRLVLVVDALDECDSDDNIRMILWLFMELDQQLPSVNCRIFVTSRPETAIRFGVTQMPDFVHKDLNLGQIPVHIVEHDIKIFLESEFQRIGKEHNLPNWPHEFEITALVAKCNVLFIYAATVCRFVDDLDDDPRERLSIVVRDGAERSSDLPTLDEMYTQVLERSVIKDRRGTELKRIMARFQNIVGCFIVLFDVLPAMQLSKLLDEPEEKVRMSFNPLHSLVNFPKDKDEPLRVLHPSLRDFLLDSNRCLNKDFLIDSEETHMRLVRYCLRLLSKSLKRNACGLKTANASPKQIEPSLVESCLPKQVQYACKYWVHHLSEISPARRAEVGLADGGEVQHFFRKNLLHWLEAMSIIMRMSECVLMITKLETLIESDVAPGLHAAIYDAKRFVFLNRSTIEHAPLQAYSAALLFSPAESLTRKQYAIHISQGSVSLGGGPVQWESILKTFQASTIVKALKFTPDGECIASLSSSRANIDFWDTTTGALRYSISCSQYSTGRSFALSRNGKLVALGVGHSTSMDDVQNKIIVHDATTGVVIRRLNSPFQVAKLSFTGDDTLVAMDNNGTFGKVNPFHGEMEPMTFVYYQNSLQIPELSDDGLLMAAETRLEDGSFVYVWRTDRRSIWRFFPVGNDQISCIKFSPDSRILSAGLQGSKILLWNTKKEILREISHELSGAPSVLAFSRNKSTLAAAFTSGVIAVWDISQEPVAQLRLIKEMAVEHLSFSVSSDMIVSGSGTNIIKLWDIATTTGQLKESIEETSSQIERMIFCREARLLASGLANGVIKMWKIGTEDLSPPQQFTGYDKKGSMAFSADGSLFITIENTKGLTVYDILNNQLHPRASFMETVSAPKTPFASFTHATFSPDNKLLAAQLTDGGSTSIVIWDLTGLRLKSKHSFEPGVRAMAFSPDNKRIALTISRMIIIMDVDNGETKGPIKIDHALSELWFSSDMSTIETSSLSIPIASDGARRPTRKTVIHNPSRIRVKDSWVYLDNEKTLLLPVDYQKARVLIEDDVVILGLESGSVASLDCSRRTT